MDFLFNFGGSDYTPSNLPPALSIEGTGVTLANAPIKNGNIDWFVGGGKGDFYYGVYFTNQGKGGSDPYDGPLQFTVKNATIDDLIQTNDIGEIFLADVLSPTGATGLADVSSGEKHQVPEPGSLVLLGLGIAGLAGFKRFKD